MVKSFEPVMWLELDGVLVENNIFESNFLRDFGLKKDGDHLVDSLSRHCVRLDEVELHEEGALRVLEDVEVAEIVESLRQLVRRLMLLYRRLLQLDPDDFAVVFVLHVVA